MNGMLSKEQILDATNGGLDVFEFFIKGFPVQAFAVICRHLTENQLNNSGPSRARTIYFILLIISY